jgi:hypothetical protein
MDKNGKILLIIVIVLIIAWLFDFSSWARGNMELIIVVMLGSIIGGIWWIADKLKEIEGIILSLFDEDDEE